MAKTEGQKRSLRQENRISRDFKTIQEDAKRVKGSGRMWNAKGDVSTKQFLIEAKTKAKPSKTITVKREWLDKIDREAFVDGKTPVLAISFGDSEDFFVLKGQHFLEICAKLAEYEAQQSVE